MDDRLYVRLDGDTLYAPETSVPAGTMRGFDVSKALSRHVSEVSVYRDVIRGVAFERIVPDGAVRMIFELGRRRGCVHVSGPSVRPKRLRLEGEFAHLTVTFRRGAASELLDVPAGVVGDQCVSLGELWGADVAPLADQVLASSTDAQCNAIVQRILAARLTGRRASERRHATRAQQALARGCTVRDTAERLGISGRRLQQIFEAEVGLSPRQVRRLARIHACLRTLRENPWPRWSAFALEHGFYDQAHLSNEFRTLVGLAPTEFVALVSGSSKTSG